MAHRRIQCCKAWSAFIYDDRNEMVSYPALSRRICGVGAMFLKMSKKHTKRIMGYEDKRHFWNFFDLKAYIIMACMMGGGIGFREAGIFPDLFVAFFYSGLGCALASAGVIFITNFIRYVELAGKEAL